MRARRWPLSATTALIYLAVALFVVASLWPWSRDAEKFDSGLEAVAREDWAAAAALWRPLAESGYAPAQYNLALLYEGGQGVMHDPVAAARWYRRASEQDFLLAKVNLALLHVSGVGVTRDYGRASALLQEAAAAGNGQAQTNLGNLYLRGLGVARDEIAAASLFRAAAQQDNQVAQVRLGQCYQLGQGVRVDEREAFAWFSLAARRGNALGKSAERIGESLLVGMEPERRAEARRRAAALHHAVPVREPEAGGEFALP